MKKEVTEVIPEGHNLGLNGWRKVQGASGDWAAVRLGVSGGDAATPNLILGENSVEAIVTEYQGKCFEEKGAAISWLMVGLQRAVGFLAVRHAI
jgi:hypothetical protein